MALKSQIEADIKTAMLAKKKEELTALRAIKSAILLAETEKGAEGALTEDAEIKLLTKAAKQRKDSAEIFQSNDRQELADKEMLEYEVISRYMPQQLSEAEVNNEVSKIIAQLGAQGMQDMGKVMGVASKSLAGKAEGKMIANTVKNLLSN